MSGGDNHSFGRPQQAKQFNGYITYSMFNQNGAKSSKDLNKKYKNIPNATTQGTTFDVRHLDRFI